MIKDHDRGRITHAILGCIALFIIWPLNMLIVALFKNIRLHITLSVMIMLFLIVAYSLGINTSLEYNRSKHFNSAHQIMCFLTLIPILLLSILPLKSISTLHTKIRTLHTPLVSTTFVLLVIAAGLGLNLSGQTRAIYLAYSSVALIVFVFNASITVCVRRRGSAYSRKNRRQEDDEVPMSKLSETSFHQQAFPPPLHHQQQSYYGNEPSPKYTPHGAAMGGGTMPGPQYMLNMHPGVPVQPARM